MSTSLKTCHGYKICWYGFKYVIKLSEKMKMEKVYLWMGINGYLISNSKLSPPKKK